MLIKARGFCEHRKWKNRRNKTMKCAHSKSFKRADSADDNVSQLLNVNCLEENINYYYFINILFNDNKRTTSIRRESVVKGGRVTSKSLLFLSNYVAQ